MVSMVGGLTDRDQCEPLDVQMEFRLVQPSLLFRYGVKHHELACHQTCKYIPNAKSSFAASTFAADS